MSYYQFELFSGNLIPNKQQKHDKDYHYELVVKRDKVRGNGYNFFTVEKHLRLVDLRKKLKELKKAPSTYLHEINKIKKIIKQLNSLTKTKANAYFDLKKISEAKIEDIK